MRFIAYDKDSYSDKVGVGNLAYNIGTLTKVAIMHTDKGFEDSAIISQDLSERWHLKLYYKLMY